ncbi:MAG: substrate-binding domain-containing protein [Thermodesulfobacteriota bacterium]
MRSERIRLINLAFIFLVIALQLIGTVSHARAADYQGAIKIGGTGGAYGVMAQVAAGFQKKYPQVRFHFPPSLGSSGGIKAVLSGALDLGLISRPLKAEEIRQGAVAVEYGRTPLMLVTSNQGPDLNFTLKEIASIYLGEIKNYPDGAPIRLILRPRVESDTIFLLHLSPEIAAAVRQAHVREGMITAITDKDNADTLEKIRGAMSWMTLAQFISENREVAPLALDGVRPGLETLAAGAYPYSKPFSVVAKANPTPLVKAFIEFLTSGESREILLKNGILADGKTP